MPRHIRKGDSVIVTAGNDKGTVGTVLRVIPGDIPDRDRVVVQGVNVRTRHVKPTANRTQGGIVRSEASIHISNVSPVADGKPTRVRFQVRPDGSKVRVAARGGRELHSLRGPRS
ncbi:MAG TPA: 50S ribosomal protein L24 [Phycisphaerales bacterium]|nr:50S ribosomal protein L24 [Phycisphaerales bacterium]HMP36430.1 50S ribosomal protein L24 [Phycisphaerales bacterium]